VDKSTKGATGAIGKFKNFTKGALAEIGGSATTFAVTAGLAFARFAQQGTKEFLALAKASRDLAVATGLTIEQASRWIEVAGDFGVETEALRTAIGRLNKNLTPEMAAKYGLSLTDAAGNAKSANEVFLDVLMLMNETPDAGQRARTGTALMGRGWQSLAPILGKSRSEYQKMLATVTDGQVITEKEYKQSQALREAMQDLGDEFNNLKMEVGGVAAEGSGLLGVFGDYLKARRAQNELADATGSAALRSRDALSQGLAGLKMFGDALNFVFGSETKKKVEDFGEPAIWQSIVSGIDDMNKGVGPLQQNLGYMGQNLGGVNDELSYLMGLLDDEERFLNVLDSFDELQQAAVDYYVAVKDGTGEAEQKERDYQRQVIDTKRDVLEYIGDIGNVPTSLVTFISAQLDAGSFAAVEAAIAGLARREVSFTYFGRITDRVDGERAMGGPVTAAGTYLVGERGPELFVPGTSGSIVPNGALGGTTILNVTVTNPIASGEQLANELAAYTRRNGSAWLSGAR